MACSQVTLYMPIDNGMIALSDGAAVNTRWPATVTSSDGSMTRAELLQGTTWWETQLEYYADCSNGGTHIICMPGAQVFYVDPAGFIDVRVRELPPGISGLCEATMRTNGDMLRAVITVDPIASRQSRRRTLRHELGHALGLEDDSPASPSFQSIMSIASNGFHGALTEQDARAVLDSIQGGRGWQ